MNRVLLSWVGEHDLGGTAASEVDDQGPLIKGLRYDSFDRAFVLFNYPEKRVTPYRRWLSEQLELPVEFIHVPDLIPTDHHALYMAAMGVLQKHVDRTTDHLTFHLSPGTPAMHAVWLLIAMTHYPARLIQSSKQRGVVEAQLPFVMALEYIPELVRETSRALEDLAVEPQRPKAFEQLTFRSKEMRDAVNMASRLALFDIPVILTGETGTGKEVLATAMHNASLRATKRLVAVNCGAIPANLIESELFGHAAGAFTDAKKPRSGHFREAEGGTLFLDEIGELSLDAQVKLLRVMETRKVVPVGTSDEVPVDVRIISATHKNLSDAVSRGSFREDLFYRLSVGVVHLPPLRQRRGDLTLLMDVLLDEVNRDHRERIGTAYEPRTLSAAARKKLLDHIWPGNVRELRNTLARAAALANNAVIRPDDVVLLIPAGRRGPADDLAIAEGFDLPRHLEDVERAYIRRALEASPGNRSAAARMLGYKGYQALDYRMRALEVETPPRDKKS